VQPHYASLKANRFIAMDLVDPAIDFLALANALGIAAYRADRASDIAPAVASGIASGAPNLIEIPVSTT
jgi:benzoylformate decarboxylase